MPFWISRGTELSRTRRWAGTGFVGTLLGWGGLYALPEGAALAPVLIAAIGLACWVSARAEAYFGVHDDTRIVIDETVGFWAAAAWLPRTFPVLLGAFVLFRILDAWKGPLRRLERLPGGMGVVFDDVAAGLAANAALRCGLWIMA
ncbi:MAG: hypothetical protein A2X36_15645 [Elusimicrobia bacterium GWA2_69_24]|nr:MAG: hypothetical protein A2X36_15645 [Elusimicrobia bacterium GWA2_69_24]